MAFKVRLFHSSPDYESLHVAKLTCFPLERRDYKPYSQARVCFAPDGLHLQLLAFEAEPLPESSMMAFFSFAEKVPPLALSLSANGRFSASLACTVTPVEAAVHTFTGEDLQGVYWGGNIQIPQKVLTGVYGFEAVPGAIFAGNLYKLCENPARTHYGCFYPADFNRALHDPRNLGEFDVIDY